MGGICTKKTSLECLNEDSDFSPFNISSTNMNIDIYLCVHICIHRWYLKKEPPVPKFPVWVFSSSWFNIDTVHSGKGSAIRGQNDQASRFASQDFIDDHLSGTSFHIPSKMRCRVKVALVFCWLSVFNQAVYIQTLLFVLYNFSHLSQDRARETTAAATTPTSHFWIMIQRIRFNLEMLPKHAKPAGRVRSNA